MNQEGGIAVLDFGGQYAHLIASRIRALGAHSEIVQTTEATPERIGERYQGLVYSLGRRNAYLYCCRAFVSACSQPGA